MPARPAIRPESMPVAEVRGHGFCRMTRGQIASCRRQPEPVPPACPPLQPSSLRHSDDQTIAALAAVHSAVRQMGNCDRNEFEDWGILVASRFLGRSTLVAAFNRFEAEGVWGVSPHLIPHYALHSPAGTLSLALGIRGPTLGIGGGLGSGFEGLLAALTWLVAGVVPGLWLVQTAWSPEFLPDNQGEPLADCECLALALALAPSSAPLTMTRPEFRLVVSRDLRARRDLAIDELECLLQRGTISRGAEEPRLSSIGRSYVIHAASEDLHPHFNQGVRTGSIARTVACDGSGRNRIELVTPHPHLVREDD